MDKQQKLCEKCRSWVEEKYGKKAFQPPYQHCHHLESEKEACIWCQNFHDLKMKWKATISWKNLNYLIHASDKPIKDCPICGKRL